VYQNVGVVMSVRVPPMQSKRQLQSVGATVTELFPSAEQELRSSARRRVGH
jgi:hypothetical protein